MSQQETLITEVQKSRQEYNTDGYSMSIGEIVSNYKEGEININPIFQRKFRWTEQLRTRLIESILIGVPLPSIFVYQNERGIWEVVDGVQRLSTIIEFMGELKDSDGNKLPPSTLSKTNMLPSLEGMTWEQMPKEPLQIDFRRTKLEIKIIKSTSHKNAKFEVFQRLNYSSVLSGQEFRNAVLIMLDENLYEWLKKLAEYDHYVECLDLTDRWKDEQYDYELVLRLFIFSLYAAKPIYKVDDFINEFFIYSDEFALINKIQRGEFDVNVEREKFIRTFDLLHAAKGKDVFKKEGKGTQFIESYFEAIAIGLYSNIDSYSDSDIDLLAEKIDRIDADIPKALNTSSRIPKTVEFGKRYFKND
ncbi:MAG: DUF262 domain-containing protein [Candidatus Kapaibacterium sp.]|jgi:uncharacterized protein with ParB-like and HNH nuclease domain